MADVESGWIAAGITAVAGVVGSAWAYLTARTKAPADLTAAQAVFQQALAAQAEGFMKQQREQISDLLERLDELQRRVEALELENRECRGENAQLHQMIESLEAQLRLRGIDIPARPAARSFTVVEGETVTVLTGSTEAQGRAKR